MFIPVVNMAGCFTTQSPDLDIHLVFPVAKNTNKNPHIIFGEYNTSKKDKLNKLLRLT